MDNLLANKRRRVAYGGVVGPGGSSMGRRMQPRNEKFFTLFSTAGSNVVESAAILMEFVAAPHERWAKLAKQQRHRARRRRHHPRDHRISGTKRSVREWPWA